MHVILYFEISKVQEGQKNLGIVGMGPLTVQLGVQASVLPHSHPHDGNLS